MYVKDAKKQGRNVAYIGRNVVLHRYSFRAVLVLSNFYQVHESANSKRYARRVSAVWFVHFLCTMNVTWDAKLKQKFFKERVM